MIGIVQSMDADLYINANDDEIWSLFRLRNHYHIILKTVFNRIPIVLIQSRDYTAYVYLMPLLRSLNLTRSSGQI